MNRPSLDKQTMELCDTFFCETIEYDLTNRYGKAKERIDAGLRWLFGNPSIPTYMDHPEYRVKDGKRTMDARPYGLSLEDIEALVKVGVWTQ